MGCRCTTTRRKRRDDALSSFSAALPADAREPLLTNTICAVKWSSDPFADFRRSIVEVIREVGIRDWEGMEELIYCYVSLNPRELHGVIREAFLSVCSKIQEDSGGQLFISF